ncbi:MAG: hypothetical protein ACUBOA_06435 [Candidatus Loosdrechtia sp.]|uniref:hypothetical protein n=1 Tax=Candidatus Loosdrechtia sp. TaxID=3101272 RepID=UPI003A604D3A|nr:MAG: hypothetical protein QY305_14735 [Candidatus Jettenia sp. AMX2]
MNDKIFLYLIISDQTGGKGISYDLHLILPVYLYPLMGEFAFSHPFEKVLSITVEFDGASGLETVTNR